MSSPRALLKHLLKPWGVPMPWTLKRPLLQSLST